MRKPLSLADTLKVSRWLEQNWKNWASFYGGFDFGRVYDDDCDLTDRIENDTDVITYPDDLVQILNAMGIYSKPVVTVTDDDVDDHALDTAVAEIKSHIDKAIKKVGEAIPEDEVESKFKALADQLEQAHESIRSRIVTVVYTIDQRHKILDEKLESVRSRMNAMEALIDDRHRTLVTKLDILLTALDLPYASAPTPPEPESAGKKRGPYKTKPVEEKPQHNTNGSATGKKRGRPRKNVDSELKDLLPELFTGTEPDAVPGGNAPAAGS